MGYNSAADNMGPDVFVRYANLSSPHKTRCSNKGQVYSF